MKVSIIIPFYSNKAWLEEALTSVFSQTFSDFEIILINDGSKENIDDILLKYSQNIVYFYQKNQGPGSARNFGIKKARGEYICFLDSDDLWHKNKIEKQLKFMESNNFDWSHTNYIRFNDSNEKTQLVDTGSFSGNIFPKVLYRDKIATPTVMIKRDILIQNNLFFSDIIRSGEDHYLWVNLAQKLPIGHLPEYLAKVRIRSDNTFKSIYYQLKSRGQLYELLKNEDIFKNQKKRLILGYKICLKGLKLLRKLGIKEKTTMAELLSLIIYIIPWLLFIKLFYEDNN